MTYEVTYKKNGKKVDSSITLFHSMRAVTELLTAMDAKYPNSNFEYSIKKVEENR